MNNYSKQTQSNPILPAMAGKIAPLYRMSFILMGSALNALALCYILCKVCDYYIRTGRSYKICFRPVWEHPETATREVPAGQAAGDRRGGGKNQLKTQGGKSKNPFFQNFFYLLPYKYLQIYTIRKIHDFSTERAGPPY